MIHYPCAFLLQLANHDLENLLQVLPRIFRLLRYTLPDFAVSGLTEDALRYYIGSFFLSSNISIEPHIVPLETYFSSMLQQELVVPSPGITQITIK
jgi:hypothetical protein